MTEPPLDPDLIAEVQALHLWADGHGLTPEIVDRINLAVDRLANKPQCRVCSASLNLAATVCPDADGGADCLRFVLEVEP